MTFQKGDLVTVESQQTGYAPGGYGNRHTLYPGEVFRVTRVYNDTSIVRFGDQWSVQISNNFLVPTTDANGKPRRKLGEHPEGVEGVDYILPSDPRLKWLWDDAAAYANRSSWCGTYDEICSALGLPGRPRNFNVTQNLNGIAISATIQARSQQEANELFANAIKPATEEPVASTVG